MHIIRNHHERRDGKGYPDGLAGDAVPIEAQIVSVADAYDAMTSTRPYRPGMAPARAAEEIRRSAGTQFSPRMVEAFMEFYGRLPATSS
jgi:HD-GYP domain-containing protein (c-di-GMP phosphodiesterase class II)